MTECGGEGRGKFTTKSLTLIAKHLPIFPFVVRVFFGIMYSEKMREVDIRIQTHACMQLSFLVSYLST
jgi:Golgi nucleoside diphosphatase